MNVDLQCIHTRLVHRIARSVLAVSRDEAPRLGLVWIIHVVEFLVLLTGVVGCVRIEALMVALARFLFHIPLMKYNFNIDFNGDLLQIYNTRTQT